MSNNQIKYACKKRGPDAQKPRAAYYSRNVVLSQYNKDVSIKDWIRKLPNSILLGVISVSIFWVIYIFFLGNYYMNPKSDAVLFIAFLSAPASIYLLKLMHHIFEKDLPTVMWFTCFVAGSIQWFFIPAFIYYLIVGQKPNAKY